MPMSIEEARKAMIAKRFGGNAAGAGTSSGNARRKKVTKAKVSSADDKKIAGNLKKMNMQPLAGIDEVNMFMNDGQVIHFVQPKVQASMPNKTFYISGTPEITTLDALMPNILSQLGDLTKLAKAAQEAGVLPAGDDEMPELVEDDEEMPELVEEK